jgi:FAD/FMN-containing dehydrogenase
LRELVGPSINETAQYQFKYDISLDISLMNKLTTEIREKVENYSTIVTGYGHIGDGNLHINVGLYD